MVAINKKLMPGAGGPQNLPADNYYLLQDLLYRAVAMTDSSGNVVEAYDCDAYGNTLIFTAADPSGNWQVVQRYVYSPYGTITVLNADWSTPPTGTQPLVDNLYQGMTLDSVTGLYDERFRNYSPSLGRWINQDPAGYINGANRYQFVVSDPVGRVDPRGHQGWGAPPWGDPAVPAQQLGQMSTIQTQGQEATAAANAQALGKIEHWGSEVEQAVDKFMRGSATLLHTAYEIWKKLSRRCRGRDGEDVPIEE